MDIAAIADEQAIEESHVHFSENKRIIRVNGDSKSCFEKLLLLAAREVVIVARNWHEDIFRADYGPAFTEFLKNAVPMKIILGDHNKGRAPEFLRKHIGMRKTHVKVLVAQKELCTAIFRWNDPMRPEFPVIADDSMYHVRFCDTQSSPGKKIWYSATSFDDSAAVSVIRNCIASVTRFGFVKEY